MFISAGPVAASQSMISCSLSPCSEAPAVASCFMASCSLASFSAVVSWWKKWIKMSLLFYINKQTVFPCKRSRMSWFFSSNLGLEYMPEENWKIKGILWKLLFGIISFYCASIKLTPVNRKWKTDLYFFANLYFFAHFVCTCFTVCDWQGPVYGKPDV